MLDRQEKGYQDIFVGYLMGTCFIHVGVGFEGERLNGEGAV